MKKEQSEIYGTKRPNEDDDRGFYDDIHDPRVAQWTVEKRWKTSFYTCLICALTLLATVVVQQVKLAQKPRVLTIAAPVDTDATPKITMIQPGPTLALDYFQNPASSYQVDDLLDIEPKEIPEEGSLPLDTVWVRQAGLQLMMAEKNYQQGYYAVALSHYQKALHIFPELQGVHRHIGIINLIDKEYEPAAQAFERALDEDPKNVRLLNNFGVCLMALKQFEESTLQFEKALTIRPRYSLSHFNLASLSYKQEQFEQALGHFVQHEKLNPGNLDAAQMHAQALIKLERWPEASDLLRDIARRSPDTAPVYFRLAMTLAQNNTDEEAMTALRQGIDLVDARRALAWINGSEFDALRKNEGFQKLVMDLSDSGRL
jgi:Tfp pilus assembly protein PilF